MFIMINSYPEGFKPLIRFCHCDLAAAVPFLRIWACIGRLHTFARLTIKAVSSPLD